MESKDNRGQKNVLVTEPRLFSIVETRDKDEYRKSEMYNSIRVTQQNRRGIFYNIFWDFIFGSWGEVK